MRSSSWGSAAGCTTISLPSWRLRLSDPTVIFPGWVEDERPARHLRGRGGCRVPERVRGVRAARAGGDGVRRAGRLLEYILPARDCRRCRAARRPGGHGRDRGRAAAGAERAGAGRRAAAPRLSRRRRASRGNGRRRETLAVYQQAIAAARPALMPHYVLDARTAIASLSRHRAVCRAASPARIVPLLAARRTADPARRSAASRCRLEGARFVPIAASPFSACAAMARAAGAPLDGRRPLSQPLLPHAIPARPRRRC